MEGYKNRKTSEQEEQIAVAVVVDPGGNFLMGRAKTDNDELAWRFVSGGIRRRFDSPQKASERALGRCVGANIGKRQQLHEPWLVPDGYYLEDLRPSDSRLQAVLYSVRGRPKLHSNGGRGFVAAGYFSLEETLEKFGELDHNRPETDMGKIAVECARQADVLRSWEHQQMGVATFLPQPT